MASFKITAPVEGFSGVVGGVQFADGEATVKDQPTLIAYFRRHGYEVAEVGRRAPRSTGKDTAKAKPGDGANGGDGDTGDGDTGDTGDGDTDTGDTGDRSKTRGTRSRAAK